MVACEGRGGESSEPPGEHANDRTLFILYSVEGPATVPVLDGRHLLVYDSGPRSTVEIMWETMVTICAGDA